MRVLIVNPILYTSETRNIPRINSIKDTMIYDLCLAFHENGIEVVLAAAEDYRPALQENYPFRIVFFKTRMKIIFKPNVLPLCPDLYNFVYKENYDYIISSEVFSVNSLLLSLTAKEKLIVWHELAKHNRIARGLISRIWYNIVARLAFRQILIVPRSAEAQTFISRYLRNVSSVIVDHGVNLNKFPFSTEKTNSFVVCSQLIVRKHVDGIIENFASYLKKYDSNCLLYILGEGEEREKLERITEELGIQSNVLFLGKLEHSQLINYLKCAKAMLINTEKDNNMVSIVEAIACQTPVITTSVPYNASYIREYGLGIVDDYWDEYTLKTVADDQERLINNCKNYRQTLSTKKRADTFTAIYKAWQRKEPILYGR